jgi:hypothetical protein
MILTLWGNSKKAQKNISILLCWQQARLPMSMCVVNLVQRENQATLLDPK